MLTPKDVEQLKERGISEATVKAQIEAFRRGFPDVDLAATATLGDGILLPNKEQALHYVQNYENNLDSLSVTKFVPASGAATRMFQGVYDWREKLRHRVSTDDLFEEEKSAGIFFDHIKKFAFWEDLLRVMKESGRDAEACLKEKDYASLIDYILDERGLAYGLLPKGLLKFHKYKSKSRTAFEEHLVEGALYCKESDGNVDIHFTVSPEHMELFSKHLKSIAGYYEKLYDVRYSIDFSVQDPSTDTLAVDIDNRPFREDSGELLFRPGGHGALIKNLNKLDNDLIFIKNIDNVVPDRLKDHTVNYKKLLGGILLEVQKEVFDLQDILETGKMDDADYKQVMEITYGQLNFDPVIFDSPKEQVFDKLKRMLDAPIRVCGMVKNEGEPGGGPFWVYGQDKIRSLQIVESSQINKEDPGQKEIFNKSTHFNPVDIVCSVKDRYGKKYDLQKYIDSNTGFISQKSKDGRLLKALELPGLWNGAMAKWITLFVEVPVITFNPVKTVNDLLREEHCDRA